MELRKKLKIGMGTPVIIYLVFAVISYLQTRWIGRCLSQVTEVEAPISEAMSRMEVDLVGMGCELATYLRDHNSLRIEQIKNYPEILNTHSEQEDNEATSSTSLLNKLKFPNMLILFINISSLRK